MAETNDPRERLRGALSNGLNFPSNVFDQDVQEHALKALEAMLDSRSKDLFCDFSRAAVGFFEMYREDEGYRKRVLKDYESFDEILTAPLEFPRPDPRRRFLFINAPNSRAPLKITRRMLLRAFTYHQVMPAFLHYIFPFGNQHYVRDFHVMGFRSDSCIESPKHSLAIPTMCRSGRHIELCYSLKSVERTPDQPQPWSIRQCSVYHKFDLDYEQSVWIVVKANRLIQQAVQRQCETARDNNSGDYQPLPATLAVHRILAAWAGENWHWYINDLESEIQAKIRRCFYISLEHTVPGLRPTRSPTLTSQSSPKFGHRRTMSFRSISRFFQRTSSTTILPTDEPANLCEEPHELVSLESESPEDVSAAIDDFSFKDVQDVHHFEMKANEVLLVLKANSKVIADLHHEYKSLIQNANCPKSLRDNCSADIILFGQQLSTIEQDLIMQQNKVDILLRMIADCRNLLQGILQFRSMQATNDLATKAQESAENMEEMTKEMHTIAQKTKVETVSMRIITLVTLFFLPGTFISTLMSTPMVRFESTKSGFSLKNIGIGALQLYLLVSVPLVLLTFLAWFGVSKYEKLNAKKAEDKAAGEKKGGV